MSAPAAGADAAAKQASSGRPNSRHQVNRSLSEFASQGKLRRPHLHRRQSSTHDETINPLQPSATLPTQVMRTSVDVSMSSGNTPFISPDNSRRASILVPKQNDLGESNKRGEGELIEQEQEEASLRMDGLKQSLSELKSFTTAMTKQLDDSYYSVLEKMSALKGLLTDMSSLAGEMVQFGDNFDKQTRDLESEIIRSLSVAGQWEEQQRRIVSLQKRLHASRDRKAQLTARVVNLQRSIERWHAADTLWQEKLRRRLGIISVILAVVSVVLLGIGQLNKTVHGGVTWRATMTPTWFNISSRIAMGEESRNKSRRNLLWKKSERDAEQLRAFDEL